jgi:hypothetical protein
MLLRNTMHWFVPEDEGALGRDHLQLFLEMNNCP